MPNSYRIFTDKHYAYLVTWTLVGWLPLFAEAAYRQIVLDSLQYLRTRKHSQLNAFVVMPTHLHAVLWPEAGVTLSDVTRDFKRYTSPEAIFTEKFARQKIDYLHRNPVRAGLVQTADAWLFSSARAYFLGEETYPPTDWLMVR